MKNLAAGLSVLVPNLNKAPFLCRCLESVELVTNAFQGVEVIVEDGFSTDGSWDIIQRYLVRNPSWTCYQTTASGIYNAWNSLIEKVRTEYFLIATSDDVIYLRLFEEFESCLNDLPGFDFFYGKTDLIDSNDKLIDSFSKNLLPNRLRHILQHDKFRDPVVENVEFVVTYATSSPVVSMNSCIVKTAFFHSIGPFSMNCGTAGDREWFLRAFSVGVYRTTCASVSALRVTGTSATTLRDREEYFTVGDKIRTQFNRSSFRNHIRYKDFTFANALSIRINKIFRPTINLKIILGSLKFTLYIISYRVLYKFFPFLRDCLLIREVHLCSTKKNI